MTLCNFHFHFLVIWFWWVLNHEVLHNKTMRLWLFFFFSCEIFKAMTVLGRHRHFLCLLKVEVFLFIWWSIIYRECYIFSVVQSSSLYKDSFWYNLIFKAIRSRKLLPGGSIPFTLLVQNLHLVSGILWRNTWEQMWHLLKGHLNCIKNTR